LKNTPIVERLGFESIPLAEPIDTIGEQPIDDLVARIEQVIYVTNFEDEIWFSRGGNVNPIFQYVHSNQLLPTSN